MKKTVLVGLVALFSLPVFCQESAPKVVTDSFKKMFVSATEVEWDQENPTEWEAEFEMGGVDMSASFNASGKWLETEREVKLKDVPAEVFKSIMLQFRDFEIENVVGIEKPDFKGYEIVLEKDETIVEIMASSTGVLTINTVMVDDDNEGDQEGDHEGDQEENGK